MAAEVGHLEGDGEEIGGDDYDDDGGDDVENGASRDEPSQQENRRRPDQTRSVVFDLHLSSPRAGTLPSAGGAMNGSLPKPFFSL